MWDPIVFNLVHLVLIQDKGMWLSIDVDNLYRPLLMLLVELLEELPIFLLGVVLDLLNLLNIPLVAIKHRMQRILHIVHKPSIQNSSAVFFIPLPEPWILVKLRKNLIECWYIW